MHPAAKVLIGLVLIVIGLGLFIDSVTPIIGLGIQWLTNFIIVLTGVIPIFLILIGLFIVWLEIDEWKIQRELEREEEEEKKARKRKKK